MAKLKYLIILMTCGYSFCSPWTWECEQNVCTKALHQQGQNQIGLSECLLSCDPSTLLWPLPRNCFLGKSTFELFPNNIKVDGNNNQKIVDAINRQKSYLSEIPSGTSNNELNIVVTLKDSNVELDIDTPENYTLKISKNGQNLLAR